MLRVSSWAVVAVAAFLAFGALTEGRILPGVMWSGLGLSNLLTATGLDQRSAPLKRLGQVLSVGVLVLALVYVYTILAA
jgi:hypothetical protein